MNNKYGLRRLQAAATKVGATVKIDRTGGEWIDIQVAAPAGQVWKQAGDSHLLCDYGHTGSGATDIIAARLIADVIGGTEACGVEDCEICHEAGDEK